MRTPRPRRLAEVRRLMPTDTRSPGTASGVFTPALTDLQARRSGYSWVIISQYQRNQIDEAFTTLTALDPTPVTPIHVAVWAGLHQTHGWTPATAEQALALAVQDDLPPVVAGPLLLSLLRSCQSRSVPTGDRGDASTVSSILAAPVDEGFRQRLGDAWTAFLRRYPAGVVRSFSSSDEQLAQQLRELLLPGAVGYDQALQKVRAGQLPLGALSAAAGKPYLLSLVQNAAGMICAVTPVPEIHEQELTAAREAIGDAIAIEGSALHVACSATSLWPTAKNLFRKILLAEAAAQDIARSHMETRNSANNVGTLGADPRSGDLVITPVDDTVRIRELDDTARILAASQECRSTPVAEPGPFATMSRAEIASPWLGPVAVALQHNIALYSDDAYLRSLANSCGVRAFGSLALTEILLEREHINAQEFEAIIGDLFRNNVVDLPNIGPLLAHTARTHGSTAQPILTNLTRPRSGRTSAQATLSRSSPSSPGTSTVSRKPSARSPEPWPTDWSRRSDHPNSFSGCSAPSSSSRRPTCRRNRPSPYSEPFARSPPAVISNRPPRCTSASSKPSPIQTTRSPCRRRMPNRQPTASLPRRPIRRSETPTPRVAPVRPACRPRISVTGFSDGRQRWPGSRWRPGCPRPGPRRSAVRGR
jgi:hypothetical protein